MSDTSAHSRVSLRRLGVALALLLSLTLTAFSPQVTGAQDPTETDANVRILHASPDAPAVDVIIDGAVVATNLNFGDVTDFISVSPDEHQIQVVPSGSDAASAVIDTQFDPEGGQGYIVAAAGLLADIEAKIYRPIMGNLDSDQSRLRAINLSPADGTMDVYQTGGDELFSESSLVTRRTIRMSMLAPMTSKFARTIRRPSRSACRDSRSRPGSAYRALDYRPGCR